MASTQQMYSLLVAKDSLEIKSLFQHDALRMCWTLSMEVIH